MSDKLNSQVNPSPKNGHIDVSNELAEQFAKRIRISGEEWQVLWVILRQTWGWHEPWAKISLQQFKDATGIIKPRISRLLHKLQDKKVITQKGNKNPHNWHVNSHYDQWKPLPKKVTTKKVITQKGNTKPPEYMESNQKQDVKEEIIKRAGLTQKGNGLTQKGNGVTQKGNDASHNPLSPSVIEPPKETINKETKSNIYAGRVYDYYKAHIKAGAKRDAIVSIKKLLAEEKTAEELMEYIDNYEESIKKKGTEPTYKIQANNFFGIKARWLEYINKPDQSSDPRGRELLNKFYKLYSEGHQGRPPFVVEFDLSTAEKITRIYKNDKELEQCINLFFTEKFWRRFSDNREPESFKQFYLVIQTLMEHLPKKSPWSKK